ncbi:hypothetical protein ACLK1T_13755 [Escherichia coli]
MKIWCNSRYIGWNFIHSNNLDVVAARFRSLRQGDIDGAQNSSIGCRS